MRFIIRTIIALALVWIGLLLTGYGVLVGSTENAAGLGIQCKYLTGQGMSTAQYLHTDSGIIGLTQCPVLRKTSVVIDNG
ncbi:YobH family protein [Enterobacter roggenkampii]|uniref:YobH family protein n=1 Tax=Enterobacter roggenkampii TaxID=1812935 RepID=UPI0020055B24|nr:YobH family protein [Enterobacter roggenkampii]MCK6926338.1 YobH family protein [Enterobacter roggenkampii]